MRVWGDPLGDTNNHGKELKKGIQEWNNLLKTGYLLINNTWTDFCGTLWDSIKYILPVTTLKNSEAFKITVSMYM